MATSSHFFYTPSRADEVGGQPWQLVTAVHDKIDGLYFVSNTHKVMTALVLVIFSFGGFDEMDRKSYLQKCCGVFLCNLIDTATLSHLPLSCPSLAIPKAKGLANELVCIHSISSSVLVLLYFATLSEVIFFLALSILSSIFFQKKKHPNELGWTQVQLMKRKSCDLRN